MKYIEFVSGKMASIPIGTCGGVVLAPGDKLLVNAETAVALKIQYGSLLLEAGSGEKDSLRGGAYEHITGGGKAVNIAAHHDGIDGEVALSSISADKSMIGKRKTRIK